MCEKGAFGRGWRGVEGRFPVIGILLWDIFCPAFWAPMPKVFVGILGLSPCCFGDGTAWRLVM